MANKKKKHFLLLRLIVLSFLLFFIFSEIMSSFLISVARVSSKSMIPSYDPFERILINHFSYGMTIPFTDSKVSALHSPQRGQVVVMRKAEQGTVDIPVLSDFWNFVTLNSFFSAKGSNPDYIMRRIIALPGDRVYLNAGRAFVQIQGRGNFLPEDRTSTVPYEPYLPEDEFKQPDILNNYFTDELLLADEEVFVLPDNRVAAFGSQSWGGISMDRLRGQVIWELP